MTARIALIFLTLILTACGGGGGSEGDDATLQWQAPTQRLDGSPLAMSELKGYRVYKGESESDLELLIEINDPYTMTLRVRDLSPGTHYFCVTAVDLSARESPRSDIRNKRVAPPGLGPPSGAGRDDSEDPPDAARGRSGEAPGRNRGLARP